MTNSPMGGISGQEKIRPTHWQRRAYIYLRQSSTGQVLYHRTSQINQERMAERAQALGWTAAQVQIIRTDLGQSAREPEQRQGFQEMLSAISLGQVGIIFGYEVSRLSRNNSDWYRLLEAAALFDTLIADYDGIYDLNLFNDRLLLGLKGTMSEAELHLIQLRLVAGRKRQLERGEYRQFLPTGYLRLPDGAVVQDPDERVRQTLQLVFQKFRDMSSGGQLLTYLKNAQIQLPRRQVSGPQRGELLWKAPTYGAAYALLTTPTYTGTLVYGRRKAQRGTTTRRPQALADWAYIHHGVYPAYLSWEEFLTNQKRLAQNRPAHWGYSTTAPSASCAGSALLQGLIYCGKCGQRLGTLYKPYGRYSCQGTQHRCREPQCESLNAAQVDQVVVQAFFEVLQPVQLDLLDTLLQRLQHEQTQQQAHWHNRLQQAQYETHRMQRQYQLVEPENRLVAAELERRWENSLRGLHETEQAYATWQQTQPELLLTPELKHQFQHLGQHLPQIWPRLPNPAKKELLRSLIRQVIVVRTQPEQLRIKIVWVSGHFSQHTHQIPIHQNRDLSRYAHLLQRIQDLWQQNLDDPTIARILTAEGLTTARLDHVSPHTVHVIRMQNRWLRSSSPKIETPAGYLKVAELAERLGFQTNWLYKQIRLGHLAATDYVRYPKRQVILIRDEPAVIEKIQKLKQA